MTGSGKIKTTKIRPVCGKTAATSKLSVKLLAGPHPGPVTPHTPPAKFGDEDCTNRTWSGGLGAEVRTASCSCQTLNSSIKLYPLYPRSPKPFYPSTGSVYKGRLTSACIINRVGLVSTCLGKLVQSVPRQPHPVPLPPKLHCRAS